MSSAVEEHVLARLGAARVEQTPFPHCVVDSVFPEAFYEELHDHWPEDAAFTRLLDTKRVGRSYSPQRLVIELGDSAWPRMGGEQAAFWRDRVYSWLRTPRFSEALARKFAEVTGPRLAAVNGTMGPDALLVSDRGGYVLGPHTDAPHRLVSALFYLALDEWTFAESLGTTLYRPRDPGFTCKGGPAYAFEAFEVAKRIAFLPNRLFVFPKSERSFHGVEPVRIEGIDRRTIMFDIRIPVASAAKAPAGAA
jgi:hypothetical protein